MAAPTPEALAQSSATLSGAFAVYAQRLAQLDADGLIRSTTRQRYAACLPRLTATCGHLPIADLTTGQLTRGFAALASQGLSPGSRRLHRGVLSQVMAMLIEYDVIAHDPLRNMRRITGGRTRPRALTEAERHRLLHYCDTDPAAQRRQLGDLVRFMLGTGCRIGEALALLWRDVALDLPIPAIEITGNIAEVTGRGIVRHEGKTAASRRILPIAPFVAATLTARLATVPPVLRAADAPVFGTIGRNGEAVYRRPTAVSGWIRDARMATGLDWMTSHTWRKTAATALHDAGLSDRTIAAFTGHADLTTLLNVYIGRGDTDPATAAALENAFRHNEDAS